MKISIFTPTHNVKYLLLAYESIKDQDFYEWIVVYNNGAVPLDFGDDRVKSFVLPFAPEWVGPLKAYACEQATGDVLLELDHDDMLMPNAIEEVTRAFEEHPDCGFVYSNTIHMMADGGKPPRFDERYGWTYRDAEFQGHQLDEHVSFKPDPNSVSRIWFAPNHLRAFTREAYYACGGYNRQMRILDDLDLMARLYMVTKFYHLDKGLYVYRIHGENTWLRYNQEIQDNVYRIYDQYIEGLVTKWAEVEGLRKLDLGGGIDGVPGYETVDDLHRADVQCDLNDTWPFEDNSIGVVRAYNILEHLTDPLHAMKELYRVLAPGGYALILVPSTDGRGAFQDPTHRSYWNENSFLYYTDQNWARFIDTPVRFQSMRLYTTAPDERKVAWTVAHLVKLGTDRVPGEVMI